MVKIRLTPLQLFIILVLTAATAVGVYYWALSWGVPQYRAYIVMLLAVMVVALVLVGGVSAAATRKAVREFDETCRPLLATFEKDDDVDALLASFKAWKEQGQRADVLLLFAQEAGDALAEQGHAKEAFELLKGIDVKEIAVNDRHDFERYRGIMEQRVRQQETRAAAQERYDKDRRRRRRHHK